MLRVASKDSIRFRFRAFSLLAIFCLACTVRSVNGAEIKVVTELFYPYQQLGENEQLVGYSVDVVKRLAELTGDTLDIQLLPWSVAYQKALIEPNVMIFSIGKNELRTQLFKWVGAIAKEKLYFWALPSSHVVASEHIVDFKEYTFAVIKDATTHQYMRAKGFNNLYVMGGMESNASEENRIRMLLESRADVIVSTIPTIQAALDTLKLPGNFISKVYRARELDSELYVAFNKDTDPLIFERFSAALQHMKSSGELVALREKWSLQ